MDIRHHPDDDLMLAYAGGRLETGTRLVTASHLELCGHCRERARLLAAIGGAVLDDMAPAPLAGDALARTFERIERHAAEDLHPRVVKVFAPPPLPDGARWPKALARCSATPWRWIGPGMRLSRVRVPDDAKANVFLLRIGAGRYLPRHTHEGLELTQVLHGRFHDGRALFGPGDFDAGDAGIHHQPVVQDGSECICLASLDGRLRFESRIAGLYGAMVGL
jgi:putative transcriptional regulator